MPVVHNPINFSELHKIMTEIIEEAANTVEKTVIKELQKQDNTHKDVAIKTKEAMLEVHRNHQFYPF